MKISAKKSLGQHFLFDKDICNAIVLSAGSIKGKVVVEIGPGHGDLTDAILTQIPERLVLIEKDNTLAAKLKDKYQSYPNVEVIHNDALKVDLTALGAKICIIANLPYNIGTKLVCNWLCYCADIIEHMTLMLQKEVVDRICAPKNTKDYGRLSILCQLLADCGKSFDVDPKFFTPPPKVTSSIVQIRPLKRQIEPIMLKLFEKIACVAFSARRKMLRKGLKAFLSEDDFNIIKILPTDRPENLAPDEFLRIANFYYPKLSI